MVAWAVYTVAARVDPNTVAAHAIDAVAAHTARKQASNYLFGLLSTWVLGPSMPIIPWQLELDATFWHSIR